MSRPVDSLLEQRPGASDRPVHRVVRLVAAADLADALLQGHGLAGWAGSHVGEAEGVHDRAVLDREGGQLLDQVTLLGLKAGSGVVGDQAGQPLLTLGAKEPGAVDGVEAEPMQRRSVAHVMQERGRDQQIGILGGQDGTHAARLVGGCLNMGPAVAQGAISRSACAFAHDSRVMARPYPARLTTPKPSCWLRRYCSEDVTRSNT